MSGRRHDLVAQWDTERKTLTPPDVGVSSDKLVHWVFPDRHRYEQSVARKTSTTRCPVGRAERRAVRIAKDC